MNRDALTTTVPRPGGSEIIVVKLPQGGAPSRWLAQRIISVVRSKVSLARMELDVVVLDGEPENQPAMFGSSSAAENFVRGIAPQLNSWRWQPISLDK
jgi:hypothetical protein